MLSEEQHQSFLLECFALLAQYGLLFVSLSEGPEFHLETGKIVFYANFYNMMKMSLDYLEKMPGSKSPS